MTIWHYFRNEKALGEKEAVAIQKKVIAACTQAVQKLRKSQAAFDASSAYDQRNTKPIGPNPETAKRWDEERMDIFSELAQSLDQAKEEAKTEMKAAADWAEKR